MKGTLYAVGVGPGDPELMTLKAKRILETVNIIAIPVTAPGKESMAFGIAARTLARIPDIMELVFPMSYDEGILQENWNGAVEAVKKELDLGKSVAFITLGDPTVFSTYMYMHRKLEGLGYKTEIIPGITSFCASAARAGVSLAEGSEKMVVIPSAYDCENLDAVLEDFENIVLMKVSRNFGQLVEKLKAHGLLEKSVLVSRCGCENELVEFDLEKRKEEKINYMSTIIVKKNM